MFVFANLVTTVAGLLSMVINLYIFVIIVAAFLSWVNPDPYNAIVRTLVEHPVFGVGAVVELFPPDKMDVLFREGVKRLRCAC